jgi:hypothetical protein
MFLDEQKMLATKTAITWTKRNRWQASVKTLDVFWSTWPLVRSMLSGSCSWITLAAQEFATRYLPKCMYQLLPP